MSAGGINIYARKRARRLCVQALYQWQMNETPVSAITAEHLAGTNPKKVDGEYFTDLLSGVIRQLAEVDELFAPFLDREAIRLTPIERAVLRLGTYELKERLDIPFRVVISEAVELTREFGASEAHKYVNGVLDQVAASVRSAEHQASRNAG